jgi:hypothetical protein
LILGASTPRILELMGRFRAVSAAVLGMAGALGVSCVGDVAPIAGPPDAGQSRYARVRVDVALPREGDATVTTEARFLRVTDLDAEAAQVLAGATEVPPELLPLGRCVRVSADRLVDDALASASPDAQVTMLDAGDLVVQAAGRPDRLSPRYIPEIVPLVSGVWYESEATDTTNAPPVYVGDDAYVQVTGFGGHDIGRFDSSVRLPPAPTVSRIGGVDPSEAPIVIDRNADLDVAWQAAPRGDDAFVVSLDWGHGQLLRCRSEGTHLVVKQAELADALRGVEAANLTISVERIRRVPWAAPGLDAADLVVSVHDVVPARLP